MAKQLELEGTRPSELEQLILEHTSLYCLTIPHAIRTIFFPPEEYEDRETALQEATNILDRLVETQELDRHEFTTGCFYYVRHKTDTSNTEQLFYNLATLCFCCLGSNRYYRLHSRELNTLLRDDESIICPGKKQKFPHHHIRHCIGSESGGPTIVRVYPTDKEPKKLVPQAKTFLRNARRENGLKSWIDAGDYSFAVLTVSDSYRREIVDRLNNSTSSSSSLANRARFLVSVVPTSGTIVDFLHKHDEAIAKSAKSNDAGQGGAK